MASLFERIGDGVCCLFKCTNRTVVGGLGALFIGVSLVFLFVGGFAVAGAAHQEIDLHGYSTHDLYPGIAILIAGVFFFVAGIISCTAMCKDNRCLLAALVLAIIIPLVAMSFSVTSIYYQQKNIKPALENATIDIVEHYHNGTDRAALIDKIQIELRCCGAYSVRDYEKSVWWITHPGEYPASCCSDNFEAKYGACTGEPFTNPDQAYENGCFPLVYNAVEKNLKWVEIATGVAILLLLCGLLSALMLCCARRDRDIPYQVLVVE